MGTGLLYDDVEWLYRGLISGRLVTNGFEGYPPAWPNFESWFVAGNAGTYRLPGPTRSPSALGQIYRVHRNGTCWLRTATIMGVANTSAFRRFLLDIVFHRVGEPGSVLRVFTETRSTSAEMFAALQDAGFEPTAHFPNFYLDGSDRIMMTIEIDR